MVEKFAKKHELDFDYWISDQVGTVACFSHHYFFQMSEIVYDLNSKQPKGLIVQWQQESIENQHKTINFFSYSIGLRYEDIKEKP